jgi:hypothetical protein
VKYSAKRLIRSQIIESAAYYKKLLAHLYLNSIQNTSFNWIIRLLLSLLSWPKVILLSGGHCTFKNGFCFNFFFASPTMTFIGHELALSAVVLKKGILFAHLKWPKQYSSLSRFGYITTEPYRFVSSRI